MKIRKIRKRPKAWLFPTAIERSYTNALTKLADNIEKEVRDFCKKWAETDPLRHDSLEDLLLKWLEELASALLFWVSDDEVSRLVRDFAHQTSDFNKRQFHKVLKSVYGVDIFKHEDWLDLQLKLFEKQNIALIKSIPTQLHEKLRYRFVEAVRKGERWENVADEIEKLLAIPKKRARLIARDQIGKLNGQLTKLRQEQVGITHYIWRTMLDERVRDSHQEREGKQFAWADAPEDGHPQQPILCRCYAEPVLPEFYELVSQNGVVGVSDKPLNSEFIPNWIDPAQYKFYRQGLQNSSAKSLIEKYQLTADEAVALRDYTTSSFATLNTALRNKHNSFVTVTKASLINQALRKLPDYKGVVIRTLDHLPNDVLKNYKVGEIITERAFTSASFDFTVDNIGSYPYKLIIHSKRGKKIYKLSLLKIEKEVLFKSNTQFRILERKVVNNEIHITMEEI